MCASNDRFNCLKCLLTLQSKGEREMSANAHIYCPRSCASNSVCFPPKLSELHKKP